MPYRSVRHLDIIDNIHIRVQDESSSVRTVDPERPRLGVELSYQLDDEIVFFPRSSVEFLVDISGELGAGFL